MIFPSEPRVFMSTMCTCGDMQQMAPFGSRNLFVAHISRKTGQLCPGFVLYKEEVTMNQDQWYVNMAAAIKRRDHAIRMLNRWQQQLADAERDIEKLATGAEQVPAQEQEHVHDTVVQ